MGGDPSSSWWRVTSRVSGNASTRATAVPTSALTRLDLPLLVCPTKARVTDRAAAEAQYVAMQRQLIDDAVVVAPYVQSYQRVLDAAVQGYVDDPAYAQVVFVYDLTPGSN